MGVTTGELAGTEHQEIVITIPGPLDADQAAALSAALSEAIAESNAELGRVALTVESIQDT
jgi:anti-anti-sigma regulatory factor